MENVSIGTVLQFISSFGFGGMIFVIWYYERKKGESLKILVENYQNLAGDLQTVVIMNTEAITKLNERLKQLLIEPPGRSPRLRTRGADPISEGDNP